MKLHRTKTIATVATLTGALVVATAGIAAAQNDGAPFAGGGEARYGLHEGRGHHGPGGADGAATGTAVADYLGLTLEELQAERAAGTSLADIAVAQGRTVDGLVDVVLDQIAANLAANPNLTEEQKADRLAVLEERVTLMVTVDHEPQQDRLHSADRLHTADRLHSADQLQEMDRLHSTDRVRPGDGFGMRSGMGATS